MEPLFVSNAPAGFQPQRRAHYERLGTAFSENNPFWNRVPPYIELAKRMGLSLSGFRFFQHDHNEYQIALRKPVEEPPVRRKMKPGGS